MGRGFFDSKPNIETGIIDSFKKQLHSFITGHVTPDVLHIPQILRLRKLEQVQIVQILRNPSNYEVKLCCRELVHAHKKSVNAHTATGECGVEEVMCETFLT